MHWTWTQAIHDANEIIADSLPLDTAVSVEATQ